MTSNATVIPATSSILPRLYEVVGDQFSYGVLKGLIIENGQLQQMVDRSAIIGADRVQNAKNHAQIDSLGKIVKDVKFQVFSVQQEGVVRLRSTSNVDKVDVMELEYATSTVSKALRSDAIVSKLGDTAASETPGVRHTTRVFKPTAKLGAEALQYADNMQLQQGLRGSI